MAYSLVDGINITVAGDSANGDITIRLFDVGAPLHVSRIIQLTKDGDLISGYSMKDVSDLTVKFDILGLSLLSVLKNTVTRINNEKLDVHSKKD